MPTKTLASGNLASRWCGPRGVGSNFGGSDAVRHDLTEGLEVSDEDLQKIRWKNACALLRLDPAKLGAPKAVAKAATA